MQGSYEKQRKKRRFDDEENGFNSNKSKKPKKDYSEQRKTKRGENFMPY